MKRFSILSFIVFFTGSLACLAHPVSEENGEPILLAEATMEEGDTGEAMLRELTGPTETKGIASIDPVGIIDLGAEFDGMSGRQLRARVFTIEPGGIVGLHTHQQRPGYAYILSGDITEHRNDMPGPVNHTAGSVAIEKTGISHWWENTSDAPVKALVVDIFTPETQ